MAKFQLPSHFHGIRFRLRRFSHLRYSTETPQTVVTTTTTIAASASLIAFPFVRQIQCVFWLKTHLKNPKEVFQDKCFRFEEDHPTQLATVRPISHPLPRFAFSNPPAAVRSEHRRFCLQHARDSSRGLLLEVHVVLEDSTCQSRFRTCRR